MALVGWDAARSDAVGAACWRLDSGAGGGLWLGARGRGLMEAWRLTCCNGCPCLSLASAKLRYRRPATLSCSADRGAAAGHSSWLGPARTSARITHTAGLWGAASSTPVTRPRLARASAGWRSGGLSRRQSTYRAAPGSGQPRPISRLGRAGRPHRDGGYRQRPRVVRGSGASDRPTRPALVRRRTAAGSACRI